MKNTAAKIIFCIILALSFGVYAEEGTAKTEAEKNAHRVKRMDTDSDQRLSLEEFCANSKDKSKSAQNFAGKDKDKDGFLTVEEFSTPKK